MRRARLPLALTVIVWAACGIPAGAEQVTLTPDGMRHVAQAMLQAGDAARALELTEALLARDPGDVQALSLNSQARREIGQARAAQAPARAAWRMARDPDLKFGAAMVMAQALASDGKRTRAQLWLRRAAEVAPTPAQEAVAARDFGYVKSRNPWVFSFNLSAQPSSNVNNGSTRNSFWFFGFPVELSGSARALSGFETSVGGTATYRFLPGEISATELRFSATQKVVALSSEARAQAPDVSGRDFAFAAVEAGIWTRIDPVNSKVTYDLGATLGHNWYGGQDLSDYLQLDLGLSRNLDARHALNLWLGAERTWQAGNPLRDSDRVSLDLGISRQRANRDRVSVTLGLDRMLSASPEVDHAAQGLSLRWRKAEPVAGIGISAGLRLDHKDYASSRYQAGGRQDKRIGADLSLSFEKMDYMGFVPTLDLRAGETRSNVDLFDARDMGMSFGFQSKF